MNLLPCSIQLSKSIQRSVLCNWVLLLMFFTGCGLLDNDNKGQCSINCEDFLFMRIDQEPAWSPDGEAIVFVRGSSDPVKHGIYLISPDGENLRQIYTGNAGAPSWSPDGKWIAFHQGAQIFKFHVETDSLVKLTSFGRNFHPSWSSNGQKIAYNKSICGGPETCGLWVMNKKGNEHTFIEYIGTYPTWHPAYNKILFRKNRSENGFTLGSEIWEYDVKAERKTLLSFLSDTNHFDTRYLNYSPDGEKITFISQPREGYPQVWIMNLNNQEKKQLTKNGGWSADWSPDGEWIVYTETFDTGRLWLMRPDGSEKQQLTVE